LESTVPDSALGHSELQSRVSSQLSSREERSGGQGGYAAHGRYAPAPETQEDSMTRRNLMLITALSLLVAWPLGSAQAKAPADEEEQLFYALGVLLANRLGDFQLSEEELALVIRGVKESVTSEAGPIDMQSLQPRLAALREQRASAAAVIEKKASAEFVAKASKEKGAVQTESGLVVTVLEEGTGPSPTATDRVKVHYHGTLRDGTVFDSSKRRGAPAEFLLNRVIPCWTEVVQKIKVGGTSRVVCPSDLAYGDRGSPPKIPGGAALTFEIELLSIVE